NIKEIWMDTMTKLKDTETALTKFEEAASKHAEATEQGDYKTANKNYAIIAKIITFLRERNEERSLSRFLKDSSDGPKSWAATYLLPVNELAAVQALEEIAEG